MQGGSGARQVGVPSSLTFRSDSPVPIPGTGFFLTIGIEFEVYDTGAHGQARFRVKTRRYQHEILTEDFGEVVLFHWHPDEEAGQVVRLHPHIHIGPRLLVDDPAITRRAHVPSGRVSVEDVIDFAIRDLDATPRRDDWESVINESREKFRTHANWGTGSPKHHPMPRKMLDKIANMKPRRKRDNKRP